MKNLRLIEYAVALERHRSFARAAATMRVTQPTFSRGVAALEKDLGVRLFDRSTRAVEPTPEGALFLSRASGLLEEASRLREALADYQSLKTGQLVIGVGPYPLGISVLESVARLARSHPQLHIRLIEGEWREFGARLLRREVDVAVMETSIVAIDPRFQVEVLPVHPGCFFTRAGHPLAGRKGLTLHQVLEYPLVATAIGGRVLQHFGSGAPGLTVEPATGDLMPRISITSVEAMREIVRRTDGIGMCTPPQIAGELQRGRFAVIDTGFDVPSSGYGVTWLRDRSLSPAARAFIATIQSVEADIAEPAKPLAPSRKLRSKPDRRRP